MGKLIFWMVVVFAVLFALRLWNARQARKRRDASTGKSADPQAMVQCGECGVFLPKAEARLVDRTYRCPDGGCAAHPKR